MQGVRWGTAAAYLGAEVRSRPNLTIASNGTATRLLLQRGAEGAEGGESGESAGAVSGNERGPAASLPSAASAPAHAVRGVVFTRGGRSHVAEAREGVTLAAGVFNTPQLLLLSGIGPPALLAPHGLPCHVPLAGVGANLRDHADVALSVANPSREALGLSAAALPMLAGTRAHTPSLIGVDAGGAGDAGGWGWWGVGGGGDQLTIAGGR